MEALRSEATPSPSPPPESVLTEHNVPAIVRYFYSGATARVLMGTPVLVGSAQDKFDSLALLNTPVDAGLDNEEEKEDMEVHGEGAYVDVRLIIDVTQGCGGRIWPAAEVLGCYLVGPKSPLKGGAWKGKNVVELGSGTGLVGFLVAKLEPEANVWVTDQIAMMDVMTRNQVLDPALSNCHVAQLDWGEPIPQGIPPKPDVLLLADCVYLEIGFQPLVDTLVELSTQQTEIYFCYQQRRKADKRFFVMLKKHFSWDELLSPEEARSVGPQRLFKLNKR